MARPKAVQVPGDTPAEAPEVAAVQPEAVPAEAPEVAGLPDISEIDPTTLRRSVLTKQGWVCPA